MAAKKKVAKTKKVATKKTTTKKVVAKKKVVTKKVTGKATTATAKKKKVVRKKAPATRKKTASSSTGPVDGIEPYKETKGEEYMNPDQVEHFKVLLNAWKSDLMQEVDRTVHHMQDEAANFPDPNDRATQESEFSMELRTRDRERKLIKKIDESLMSLDNDDYGYCDSCGVEIGVKRLEARPTASQCIDCKTLDEIREKQIR